MVIFGCGGHARSIVNVLYECNENMDLLLVDEQAQNSEVIWGHKVERIYSLKSEDDYIIAVGDNKKRKELFINLNKQGKGNCVSVISVNSHIGIEAKIGKGIFIATNSYIGPQAIIGDNSIINTGSIIEHEAVIGSHTHIAPHVTICGRTQIGDNVFCGAGSTVIDKITVCNNVVIGAGAVVTENIMYPGTYIGIPARKKGEI